jgi:O-antigen/teichoic acid export membrane protein
MDHGIDGSAAGRPRLDVSDRSATVRGQIPLLLARLAPFRRTLGTTAGLVVAIMVSSATGFVFWWMAARMFPAEAVGLAGAAVSAMLFLSQIAVLGLGTQLAGVLHRESRAASLALTALLAAAAAGSVFALAFAAGTPLLSTELSFLIAGPLPLVLFIAGVSLTALASVLDQVLVSLFRNAYQVLRNVLFSFSRLVVLALAAAIFAPTAMVIYGAWTIGVLLSLVVIAYLVGRSRRGGELRPLMWRTLRQMARSAFAHHVLDLSRSASVWLLPLLVTVLLSPELNASFYVAMLLANFVAVVGKSATFTLYIVGARAPHELWRHLRLTLGLAMLTAVVGTLLLALVGRNLLEAFGPGYDVAYPAVVVLTASCVPLAVKDHWIAIRRVQGTVGTAAVIGVMLLVVELLASGLGAMRGGLLGLSLARFAVLAIQSAFMTPLVYRSLFPGTLDGDATALADAPTPELEG